MEGRTLDTCLFCHLPVYEGAKDKVSVLVGKKQEPHWVHKPCIKGNEKTLTFRQ